MSSNTWSIAVRIPVVSIAKASGREALAAAGLARTASRIADRSDERERSRAMASTSVFRLVITGKGGKAGVANEFPRYVNDAVKLNRERHVAKCGAEAIRRLSNRIVDRVTQPPDIEPENRTGVTARAASRTCRRLMSASTCSAPRVRLIRTLGGAARGHGKSSPRALAAAVISDTAVGSDVVQHHAHP
jgi:hypothetical protein